MNDSAWNAGRLLELSGSYWKTCVLHALVKLDAITAIGEEEVTAQELAERIGCSPDGTERLLNAAAAMELLVKRGDAYASLPAARRYLSKDAEHYIGFMILHHHQLMPSWTDLDQAVQKGGPIRERASSSDEDWRENFLMGMFNNAMTLAPRIVPEVDLGGRRGLLDLGGGPGTYAIQFCRRYPELRATVFDLPTTRPFAEKVIGSFGLSERIAFESGNYLEDEIGSGYDAAWLSHILHAEGPEQCRHIVAKAVKALQPGGLILIHDFFLNNDMAAPLFPTLFSLNMLLGTSQGRSYSEGQVREMLEANGVRDIRRISIDTPNDSSILAGRVS